MYAETDDHRFIIEIQKIDYDYNFNRFLNYFITLLIEQQKKGEKYEIPQTVLGVVVLTRPYKINQITGEPIHENVMSIDFDPRNLNDERIKLWKHKLLFLNPNPNYRKDNTPQNYQDWLNLFSVSIEKKINIVLNLNDKGIARATKIIEIDNLDPATVAEMKISEAKKAMISIIETESKKEGIIEGINQGMKEGKLEVAKAGLKEGYPIEMISKITGLTEKEINDLKNK
ncbi:MAG: hypothetical protein NT004_08755 [Bacteroidetes bacterium]|nr:hypothetical protein [Bacteroidota bacterium]